MLKNKKLASKTEILMEKCFRLTIRQRPQAMNSKTLANFRILLFSIS